MLRSLALLLIILGAGQLLAQAPLGISYQGIARNADGSPVVSNEIGLRISISNGPKGALDFVEEHHVTTNGFGLFNIVIGQGQTSGSLNEVDWVQGNKWLEIELDPTGGSSYVLVGSQQLMSVPYALFAAQSGNDQTAGVGISIDNGKISNSLPDQIVNLNGEGATSITGSYPNFTISSTDEVNDADNDPTNEIQNLTSTANGTNRTIEISGGVATTIDIADNDSDSTNELQTLSMNGNLLELSNGGTIDLASFLDDTDTDNQNLSSTANGSDRTINISGGTGTIISVADNDDDSSNELITSGSYVADNTIRIAEGSNTTDINVGTLNADLDANSNKLVNLANPTNPGDAVNLGYLETKDANDYAINIPLTYTSMGLGNISLDLSSATLDKGGLISGDEIIISEPGVYAVSVYGVSLLSAGSAIDIEINGIPTEVLSGTNHYLGQYLFELNTNDVIQIVVKFGAIPETVKLQIAVYKI